MTQTHKGSLTEACINVAIGYGINLTTNALLFPLFGWHIALKQNVMLGVFYTFFSIVRSYCIWRSSN